MVTKMLFDHEWQKVDVCLLRMEYSASIDQVGVFSLNKVRHLLSLVFRTWKICILRSPHSLYYLPASPNVTPILRDFVYLALTRWVFKKTIFHYHAGGLAEYVNEYIYLKWFARKVYGRADLSIELSSAGVSPSEYFHAKKRVYVPNGVDVEGFASERVTTDGFRVLFMGALTEGKGVVEIVKTATILKADGVQVLIQLVGGWVDEAFKEQIMSEIDHRGLTQMFEFSGVLTGQDKWEAFAEADCFLFPSHYSAESFPMVLIEAMACGLPLVTTRWRGITKILGDSHCGYLCDVKAPEQYAEKVFELLHNLKLRRSMGELGRKRFEAEFTKEKFLERMEHEFKAVSM
ncbi:glycosyltransferase family 4 protein [Rubritalea marina]|uniref:glycosyltransferase family 4 protein n=1 Tax=Rubritalea marina TaxID=361055 RepID=UPI0014614BD8|nr:glycosyltransferase family 4 protein [Rubritalea marina]